MIEKKKYTHSYEHDCRNTVANMGIFAGAVYALASIADAIEDVVDRLEKLDMNLTGHSGMLCGTIASLKGKEEHHE